MIIETVSKTQDEQTKEFHRKKLRESIKRSQESLRDIPELEDPSFEQQEWIKRRMKGSVRSWETYTIQ